MNNQNFDGDIFQPACENAEACLGASEIQASACLFLEWLESTVSPLGELIKFHDQNALNEDNPGPDSIAGEIHATDVMSCVQPDLERVGAHLDQILSQNEDAIPHSVRWPIAANCERSQDPGCEEIMISLAKFIRTEIQPQSHELPGAEIALGLLLAVSAVTRRGHDESLPLNLTIAATRHTLSSASEDTAPQTYTIALGESLESIAVSLFGDSGIGWLLADLNRGQTRQEVFDTTLVVEVKAGTRLVLPSHSAASRYKTNPDSKDLKNLVTIITANAFESEIGKAMSGAMGCDFTGHPSYSRLHEEFV